MIICIMYYLKNIRDTLVVAITHTNHPVLSVHLVNNIISQVHLVFRTMLKMAQLSIYTDSESSFRCHRSIDYPDMSSTTSRASYYT